MCQEFRICRAKAIFSRSILWMSADPVQAAIQAVLNDLEALKTSKDEAVP
jgi:hypothetical protein